jgi:LAO/AO transport system kinase
MSFIDIEALFAGNRRTLAKAITLIESSLDRDRNLSQQVIEKILPHVGSSIRIGITGVPGVGKSTFIEALGLLLINLNKRVAVLTIDPSSPVKGGSILGDKTRMELLSREDNAFIRPSPSLCSLGGVAQKTRETLLLCEASGFDVVIVESVGVGQSECEMSNMVDFMLVLGLPNAGDELQGIKKGIIELADSVVINKCDGENINLANLAKTQYENALALLPSRNLWKPRVETCSAIEGTNIDLVWKMICDYWSLAKDNGIIELKRSQQNKEWMWDLFKEALDLKIKRELIKNNEWIEIENQVINGAISPFLAAQSILESFNKN